jgi:hypothetical protein
VDHAQPIRLQQSPNLPDTIAPHGALHLGMTGMADQHDLTTGLGVAHHFQVHLGDQRASGVEDAQPAPCAFLLMSANSPRMRIPDPSP